MKALNPVIQNLKPFHLCCAAAIKCTQEVKQIPAFKLMEEYFDWMVHYLDHGEVVHEFIPFRIEHIIEVIELSLHDLIKTRELDFEVNTHFTSKFLLGNRTEILVSLLQLSHSVIIQNSKSDVHVQINYLSEPNRLLIAFQAQNLKVSEFEVPFDTELESDDNNLKLAFSCNAILEQSIQL